MTAQVIAAVPVPFTEGGELDLAEYEKALLRMNDHVHGALIAGTTGEFPALDDDERLLLFRNAAEILGRDRVIAHLGHPSLRQVLRLADRTAEAGITRFALLSPYYLPSDDDGVVAFFHGVTQLHREAEVYAYLFPERTGMDITVDTLRRVMELPGMRGVKLSGDAARLLPAYGDALRAGQELFSGDDSALPWVLDHGGTGVVSGVSAAFPELFSALVTALDRGDGTTIDAAQAAVAEVVGLAGPTIPRLKVALAARTGTPWAHRMALPAVDERTATAIRAAVAQYT